MNNKDSLCLLRALVVSIAHINKDPLYFKIRHDRNKLQTIKARDLIEKAQCVVSKDGCGIPELKVFEHYFQGYKNTVYRYSTKGRDVMLDGVGECIKLNLLYHEGHNN